MTSDLYDRIQTFYDQSSGLWEREWGEHMHHGYYGPTGTHRKDPQQAQVDLMEALLQWGQVSAPRRILDAGCGIGGSALYLHRRYDCEVVGLTLSPVQAARATERAMAAGVADRVSFVVADVLATPYPAGEFDLIWSLESGEHYPDKAQFFRESDRILRPGGRLLMATWCHRPTTSLGGALTWLEQQQLQALYRLYHLPYVLPLPDYAALAQAQGFSAVQVADWSAAVAPFWDQVLLSVLRGSAIAQIFQAGWETVQGAIAIQLMRQGFANGLLRYGLLTAIKDH